MPATGYYNKNEAQRSTRKGYAASVRRQSRRRLRDGFIFERKMEMTDMELYRHLRKPVKRNGVSFKIAGKYAGNRL